MTQIRPWRNERQVIVYSFSHGDFSENLTLNMGEGKFGRAKNFSQDKTGVYVGDAFDLGYLVQQEFLVVLHIRYEDL